MRPIDECLLRKKSGGIVTDGLLFWIDGQDEASYGYSMFDRVSEKFVDFNGHDVIVGKSSDAFYSIQAPDDRTLLCDNPEFSDTKTVELTVGVGHNMDTRVAMRTFYGGVLSITYDRVFINGAAQVSRQNSTDHIVVTPDSLYINGVWHSQTTLADFGFSKWTMLLRPYRDSSLRAVVGSLRFYNRTLTDDEIMQNYNYEKSLGRAI